MIIVKNGFNRGSAFKLGARTLTAGRDVGNLIQLIDKEVSRRHFQIRWTPRGYFLRDMNSANGTFINGAQVQEKHLQIGDTIKAGNTVMELMKQVDQVKDASLERKVVDRQLVGGETMAASMEDFFEMSLAGGPSQIIDVEETENKRLSKLDQMLQKMATAPDYLDISCTLIMDFICPDRIIIFQVVEGGKIRSVKLYTHPMLSESDKRVRPEQGIVRKAFTNKASQVNNMIKSTTDKRVPGSVLVVPIKSERRMSGVVYIDTMPENRKFFDDTDIGLINRITEVVVDRWG